VSLLCVFCSLFYLSSLYLFSISLFFPCVSAEQSSSLLPATSQHGHSWHRAPLGPMAIYLFSVKPFVVSSFVVPPLIKMEGLGFFIIGVPLLHLFRVCPFICCPSNRVFASWIEDTFPHGFISRCCGFQQFRCLGILSR
jgi:hypothetical protein